MPILDGRATPTLVGGNVGFHTATMLYDLCSRVRTRFVETSPGIIAREKQEFALSRAGKLSTPFDFHPLKPEFGVTGDPQVLQGIVDGGVEKFAGAACGPQHVVLGLRLHRAAGYPFSPDCRR